jgi:hypothetical protein
MGASWFSLAWAQFGLWMVHTGAGSGDSPWWYQIFFWTAWFAILVYSGYREGTAAREIVVHGDDHIEFVGLWSRVRVPAAEVSVDPCDDG